MINFPSSLKFIEEGYSYRYSPSTVYSQFSSQNTRVRQYLDKRTYAFSCQLHMSNAELAIFESFYASINNGADEYTGEYFTSGTPKTGTLQIVDGVYSKQYLSNNLWLISYNFELKDRDFSDEQMIYESVIAAGGF